MSLRPAALLIEYTMNAVPALSGVVNVIWPSCTLASLMPCSSRWSDTVSSLSSLATSLISTGTVVVVFGRSVIVSSRAYTVELAPLWKMPTRTLACARRPVQSSTAYVNSSVPVLSVYAS